MCHAGQARIATQQPRDRHDLIIVQEKLDGSNVGVARLEGRLYPLTRSGYLASTSPYEQHWRFSEWVYANQDRFMVALRDGERLCGEWLMQAHGTRYQLPHEPFVVFDLMVGVTRATYDELFERIMPGEFVTPTVIHRGGSLSIAAVMRLLNEHGFHRAIDPVEGAVWRIERDELIRPGRSSERRWIVDFLAKYVRPDKTDGCYLPEVSGQPPVWNWYPT